MVARESLNLIRRQLLLPTKLHACQSATIWCFPCTRVAIHHVGNQHHPQPNRTLPLCSCDVIITISRVLYKQQPHTQEFPLIQMGEWELNQGGVYREGFGRRVCDDGHRGMASLYCSLSNGHVPESHLDEDCRHSK